ncbi:Omega-6 fatty acid desaturase chloroplastic [Zea mays]|uniref:Omega-6 fatty acid desaturase chloroplastic n=1 Tax=Zea mays TaxID=4577 RepID=A0A1D6KNS8_MAIZE|nr:Omega-6 fatty acid desaturase chloroplastic [Zea mays]
MSTASGVSAGSVLQLPSFRVPAKRFLPRRTAAGAPAGNFFVKRDIIYNRSYHQFLPLKHIGGLQAAVLPVTPPLLDGEGKKKQMAEEYGFTQIGDELPDDITLKDVMDTLPKEVFEINDVKAWTSVLISVTSYALGLYFIAKSPWYLLPLAWAWTGTAVTGHCSFIHTLYHFFVKFFVIGHDCAHKSFSRNKLVEDVVGTLAFMPLIYPYEPWRFKHDRHHAKTNMLIEDTAWQPVWQKEIESSPFLRKAIIFGYGPIRPWMSIAHWLIWHFDLKKFRPNEVPRMSTFTMVHHTAPHIPFKSSEEWNAAQAQLNGTVHCNYPQWIEILCHDINVHVPHHISPRIPSYNLRAAYDSIKQNWGKYVNEANWNWRLMKTILTRCHVYDKERYYVPFDELAPQESQPIKFLRKFMPDYA